MYRTMIEGRRMNALVGKEGHSGSTGGCVVLYRTHCMCGGRCTMILSGCYVDGNIGSGPVRRREQNLSAAKLSETIWSGGYISVKCESSNY